jgi:hypothetical protein
LVRFWALIGVAVTYRADAHVISSTREEEMGIVQSDETAGRRLCLHPSVGVAVDPEGMTPSQKVAAVSKVRCLEHDLFEGRRLRRELSSEQVGATVARINELRSALGWLEIDSDGQLRWPHLAAEARVGAPN